MMYTKPAEAETKSHDRPENQNPGSPCTVIGEAAENEEEDDLDGEGDAIREKDDAVDAAVGAEEFQSLCVTGGEVELILKCCTVWRDQLMAVQQH